MAPLAKFSGTLSRRNAAHLLRRATFGPDRDSIDTFTGKTVDEALGLLTQTTTAPTPPLDLKTGESWLPKPDENTNSEDGDLSGYFKSWWLNLMRTDNTMRERMVFLYHTFFPTIESAVEDSTALYYQNALFRFYAFGNIQTLTKKVCIDNAMLILLDGRSNEVGLPNENFAREFFELHTIGKGPQDPGDPTNYTNYTEYDIQVASRILSGWANDTNFGTDLSNSNIDEETGIPLGVVKGEGLYATRHDASNNPPRTFSPDTFPGGSIAHLAINVNNGQAIKASVMGRKATTEQTEIIGQVDQLVNMVFEKEATALNFCRKIYRFFCYYNITDDVETNIIKPLATTLISNNYEILPVIKELLSSQYFYDANNAVDTDDTHADIIKSPLELSLGAMRFFNVATPAQSSLSDFYDFYSGLLNSLNDQGISLYEPYDVAGYDAYHQEPDYHRNWITVNTLAYRYEFAMKLATNSYSDMISVDYAAYVKDNVTDPTLASNILQHFVDYMLPEVISTTGEGNRFDYFLNILKGDLTDTNWRNEWNDYISSGMNDGINSQIEILLSALMQTPEYQLM